MICLVRVIWVDKAHDRGMSITLLQNLWGETCSATRRRVVVLKERDVEKGLYLQRGGRVFENLTSSNGDKKDEREGSRAGRRPPFL